MSQSESIRGLIRWYRDRDLFVTVSFIYNLVQRVVELT